LCPYLIVKQKSKKTYFSGWKPGKKELFWERKSGKISFFFSFLISLFVLNMHANKQKYSGKQKKKFKQKKKCFANKALRNL
jgi:hypothetical protein